MIAYKGFDKNLQCLGFQYEIGKEYFTDTAEICKTGFHACRRPFDVLSYYGFARGNRFCLVDITGVAEFVDVRDTKLCGTRIKVLKELTIREFLYAQCEYTKDYAKQHNLEECIEVGDSGAATAVGGGVATAGYRGAAAAGGGGAATAGDSGAAAAGDSGAAAAGYSGAAAAGYSGAAAAGYRGAAAAGDIGAATAGDEGTAAAGYRGAATAGDSGAATAGGGGAAAAGDRGVAAAGDEGTATAGYRGTATAGYRGAATAGYRGAATAGGVVTVGDMGIGLVRGVAIKARGGINAVITVCIEDDNHDIKEWKSFVVDGERIKANVFYTLIDGEIVEVNDNDY